MIETTTVFISACGLDGIPPVGTGIFYVRDRISPNYMGGSTLTIGEDAHLSRLNDYGYAELTLIKGATLTLCLETLRDEIVKTIVVPLTGERANFADLTSHDKAE